MLMKGMLSNVRQLDLEFHLPTNFPEEGFRELIAPERTGFVHFDSKYNRLQLRQCAGFEIACTTAISYIVRHFERFSHENFSAPNSIVFIFLYRDISQ